MVNYMKPLVSIITPCFNGVDFLDDYFNSILEQTYDNIELFFIDDGSTDGTKSKVDYYKEKLQSRKINVVYIYQKNQGQAAALNQGLQLFNGDYFIWPDSDDILSPDSIEKRVSFLEQHLEFDMVRSNAYFFDFESKRKLYRASNLENRFNTDIFKDLILEESYCYCGCYMVRRNAFLEIYPERKIKVYSAGQNWQLLIPLSGRYKCGYIDEDLYHIAVRNGSHSRQNLNYEKQIQRQKDLKEILLSSIDIANRKDLDYYQLVEEKYVRRFFMISLQCNEFEQAKIYYNQLKEFEWLKKQDNELILFYRYPRIYKVINMGNRIRLKFLRIFNKVINNE